ncbi:MAG: MFS transporter, partial [Alphaproteobacteria bacterium]
AHLLLGFAESIAAVYVGAALWGVHLGMTQGIFAALVADTAPRDLRGTAFGLFNMTSGLSLLVASVGAGLLWDVFGPTVPFLTGAVLATLALFGLIARAASGRRRPIN